MYRYTLSRGPWLGHGRCLFVMLNPSTADDVADDPTIRRCVRFAQRWSFQSLSVGNLYARRATKPQELFQAEDPVGRDNDHVLRGLAMRSRQVVAAWGAAKHPRPGRERSVNRLLREFHPVIYCLGRTASGHPRHPLYVPADTQLEPFDY